MYRGEILRSVQCTADDDGKLDFFFFLITSYIHYPDLSFIFLENEKPKASASDGRMRPHQRQRTVIPFAYDV